jgi:JmjC domain, hydroxylase
MPLEYAQKFKQDVRLLEQQIREAGGDDANVSPCPGVLMHADKVFDPQWFVDRGYKNVTMFIQRPGEFMLTHPLCAHFVWNWGPCVKEAVSIGSSGWVPFGLLAVDCNAK